MYLQTYKSRTTKIDTARGLLKAIWKLIKFLFWATIIIIPLVFLLEHAIAQKTSDASFCPRISSATAKAHYGCPPAAPIAIKK